jgi:hypothetical protein
MLRPDAGFSILRRFDRTLPFVHRRKPCGRSRTKIQNHEQERAWASSARVAVSIELVKDSIP